MGFPSSSYMFALRLENYGFYPGPAHRWCGTVDRSTDAPRTSAVRNGERERERKEGGRVCLWPRWELDVSGKY